MAYEVKIPSLGESVSEATLGRWLKDDGAAVETDEPILELESDKANMELAAEYAGRLKILTPAGATVQFGDVVAVIEEAAEGAARAPAQGTTKAKPPAARDQAAVPAASPASPASPVPSPAAASAAAAAAPDRPLGPAVRRIVTEEKLDAATLEGTGPRGRILKGDALRAVEQRTPGATAAAQAAAVAQAVPVAPTAPAAGAVATARARGEGVTRVPMSRVRQVIARRLVESQQGTATLTTFNEIDMSAVLEIRARYKESFEKKHGVGLGFMSFFVAACCEAMRDVPEANARIDGNDIVYNDRVHVGVAVGTERGLVVPVVRDAERLAFAEIEAEIARLADLARTGKLMPDDLSGATFTISNGGVYGSLLSTPILNPPQSAILGMHKTEKRPVVVDDQVVVRPMMYLALSYDHRLIDGKDAVTYLVRVKERLEDPTRLLLRI
jgi:2-oxoglutarate dehydrogenase E2 component (dihydrolipoamide succinyltransferase)